MTKKAHWVQGGAKQVGEEQLRTLLSNSTVIGFAGGTPENASFGTLGNADAEFSGGYNLKTKKDFDFKLVGQQFCGDNDLGDGYFSLYVMPASAWYFAVADNEEVETYNQALVGCIVFRG